MKITCNADVVKFIRENVVTPHVTALNGILDKLPENLRPDFTKLKNDINATLEKLAPTDQVPAAMDAAWALNSLSDTIVRMNEYMANLVARITDMSKSLSEKATAMQALEDQQKNLKDLAEVKELCKLAKQEGVDSMLPAIVGLRKKQCELAGLPEAPQNIIELAEDAFKPAFDGAVANLKTLTEKGLKLGGKGEHFIKKYTWKSATEFAGEMAAFGEFLGTPAVDNKVDPLLGAGAGGTDATDKTKKAALLSMA